MEFSRVGEHTIKCVISEDEITDLGFTLDEIMSNGERTQEFMNHIFDLAEQQYEMKFDMGIKTVRADFLPNHTLSLTFSEHQGSAMVEHLKDIVNGFLNSIPPEQWEELKNKSAESSSWEENTVNVIALFTFASLEVFSRFAKQVSMEEIPVNALYKYQGKYILTMDLSDCSENEVLQLSILTDEYASGVTVGPERRAFMEEHAEVIMGEQAIENMKLI